MQNYAKYEAIVLIKLSMVLLSSAQIISYHHVACLLEIPIILLLSYLVVLTIMLYLLAAMLKYFYLTCLQLYSCSSIVPDSHTYALQ